MTFLDWFEAIIILGLPMAVLSWIVFRWVYRRGDIDKRADHKALSARLKEMKANFKTDKANKPHFVYRRWMGFGSGFYGLTGLWTFFVIETSDVLRFLFNPVTTMSGFTEAPLEFIINVLMNQLGNFISALVWFFYWGDNNGNFLLWIAIAWLGYWVGIKLAQRDAAALHLDRIEQRLENSWLRLQQIVRRR